MNEYVEHRVTKNKRITELERANEALAERLAKVEDRLAEKAHDIAELNRRIDKVAEIIGERVSGLVENDEKLAQHLADMGGWQDAVTQALDGSSAINAGWWRDRPNEARPYFPTGGASTAEAATDAVLPVPQRGDRVLIKDGSQTLGGAVLKEQWATVIGVSRARAMVQVELDGQGDTRSIPWLVRAFIKEVRHAQ